MSGMKDMTQGSVTRHLLHMASFMAVSMVVQTLYLLADLYWVGTLGKEAIAAVGLAGNLMMVVLALTQMLGVGTTTIISQAAGRKDQAHAELGLNQSAVLSVAVAILFAVCSFPFRRQYSETLSADAPTAALAASYLVWFIPSLMLQFPLVSLGSALRATGIIKPAVGIQVLTVILNMGLAPLFIFGLGPFPRMGVSGAAFATFLSVLIGNVFMILYFQKSYRYVRFRVSLWRPQLKTWWSMLRIGIPAGAEFALMAVYIAVVYVIIRHFGAAAQAGFGIGARVMQAMFLPIIAVAFSLAPIVGQNFGGRRADRVRQSFYSALAITTGIMLLLTLLSQFSASTFIRGFTSDPGVIVFGSEYLQIISLNFVAMGIIFTSSSVFQGIGNTWPPLISSATRLVLFALPAVVLSRMPGFQIKHLWYLSVVSILFQAGANLLLLRREFQRKLVFPGADGLMAVTGSAPA
ncbi:MAG TPA: MATE family efflux transporter [Chthoniobacterales bacterium]|jgi:putative MATE family efflux protein|nr:MATE family efflux transporter [Chthoniobacterales bacterium]